MKWWKKIWSGDPTHKPSPLTEKIKFPPPPPPKVKPFVYRNLDGTIGVKRNDYSGEKFDVVVEFSNGKMEWFPAVHTRETDKAHHLWSPGNYTRIYKAHVRTYIESKIK